MDFYQKELITELFSNTTKGLFEEKQQYTFNIAALNITESKTKKPRSFKNLPRT